MLDFMAFMLNVAWKILGVVFGFMLFSYVLRNGKGTFRELLDTLSIGFKAMVVWIRKKLIYFLKKESSEQEKETAEEGPSIS